MIYFYIFIILLLIFNLFLGVGRAKNITISLATIYLVVISSLRSEYFGSDVEGYLYKYIDLSNYPLEGLLGEVVSGELKDPSFYVFSKIISLSGAGENFYLAILSTIYLVGFALIVRRYSPDPVFSYIFLVTTGFLYFSYTGLRQALAMALLMVSFIPLIKKEYLKFACLVALASLFHLSALVFAFSALLIKFNLKRYGLVLVLIVSLITVIYPDTIRTALFSIGLQRLDIYENNFSVLNASGLFIYSSMYIYCHFFSKDDSEENTIFMNLALTGVMIQALSLALAEFFRVAMYFNICFAVLLPRVAYNIRSKNVQRLVNFGLYGAFIAYFIYAQMYTDFELTAF